MTQITFPDAVNGRITCDSDPMNGVRVKIGSLDAQVNDDLKLSWQGCSDTSGKVPIPGTETSLTFKLTSGDIANGVEKTIGEYFQHIKPIKNGSALVTCTINGGGGTSVSIVVMLLNTAGLTCDQVKPLKSSVR